MSTMLTSDVYNVDIDVNNLLFLFLDSHIISLSDNLYFQGLSRFVPEGNIVDHNFSFSGLVDKDE